MQTEKHGWRDNSIEELQSQIQIDVFVGKGPMFLPKRLSCDDEVPHGHVVLSSQTRWLRQLPKPNCLQPSVKCSASAGSLLSKSRTAGSEALWWGRDLLRRMVARCLAHTYATPIHQACQPHQFALSTRAGTEAVVHALTAATEQTPDLTILSIDGVGAFDTISRQAMLQGLAAVPEANRCIPFVRMFYAQPSAYIWHDNAGAARTILQAEGGEQGDPLMPALFSLGQRAALQRAQQELQEGEHLFAFLDDVYVLSQPARIRPIYDLLAHHLHAHARIRPPQQRQTEDLERSRLRAPKHPGPRSRRVGREPGPPPDQSRPCSIGGTRRHTRIQTATLTADTHPTHGAAPSHPNPGRSASILVAPPLLRESTLQLSPSHASARRNSHVRPRPRYCGRSLLHPTSGHRPHPSHIPRHRPPPTPFGLSSASVLATPAYWASWADTLPVLAQQAPQLTRSFVLQLQQPSSATPSLHSAIQAAQRLEQHGWQPPTWNAIVEGEPPPTHPVTLKAQPFKKVGNAEQPRLATPHSTMKSTTHLIHQHELCWPRNLAPMRAVPSPPFLTDQTRATPHTSSG